jgi:membrane protein implicated in regulation of membrane protease activity
MPAAVGAHRLVGTRARVRGDNLVFVDGELWRARSADGEPLRRGEDVFVEDVEEDGLRLVVGSPKPTEAVPAERT